ncbi:MAG: UMP kinase [Candidatus Pacebacteria bacterium]|nr:UMP kinase [Candidatus Paceibacterota bacterium]
MSKTRFKRVLLKIGGESLLGNREYGIDPQAALDLANHIKQIYALNVEVVIVIGAGNIFRGLAGAANGIERATADYMGMMATVMNGLALHDALEKVNVPVRIQSALQMPAVAEAFIRRKAIRHMEKGRVVIIGAGTGVPYVTTDTGSSLHGLELRCDVLMKATKVNGVYEKDPVKFPKAKRYKELNIKDAIENDNVQIMDTAALAMCKENGLPIMVFKLFEGDNLSKAVLGEDIGTFISNEVKTKLV